MDQLKPIIAGIKKYHFWILSVIILLTGLVGWYMSTADLDAQYTARKTEIKDRENSARTIANTQNHPNAQFEENMQVWLTTYRRDIDQAWQKKWEAQQRELTWPAELNVGNTNFANEVNSILLGRPIEALTDEDKQLPTRLRELYRDYIKEELPKLADMIGAKWAPTSTGGAYGGAGGYDSGESYYDPGPSGYGGGSGYGQAGGQLPMEKPPLVVWNPSNQGALQQKSFDWSQRANNTPTTQEVLYAQENLWVLENLMRIIANTNGEITSQHQAIIKQIESIEFGREVMPIRSRVEVPRLATTTAGAGDPYGSGADLYGSGGDPYGSGGDPYGGDPYGGGADPYGSGYESGTGMPGQAVSLNPGDNRYVDKDYNRLSVSDLQSATTSPTSENYYLAVAKRLPVRLNLVMDQREIDKLLVECGNADLMVEVRQVRVNAPKTSTGGGGYATGGYDPGGGGYDTGAGYDGGSGYGGAAQQTDRNEKIFDVPVEIYGIIYIYNPVNKDLLWPEGEPGAETEGDDDEVDPTATASVATNRR